MADPVTLDFSKAQPVEAGQAEAPTLDFSKAQPIESQSQPSSFMQDVGKGVGTPAAQTASTLASVGSHIPGVQYVANKVGDVLGLPKLEGANSDPYATVSQSASGNATAATRTPGGKVGAGLEGIAEFFMGDEALKGLSVADKLGMAAKVAKLAESHPFLAKLIGHGLTSIRGGTVAAGQQMAHGATSGEALATGAEAAGLGTAAGAVTESMGALAKGIGNSLRPTTETVGETEVPVRAKNALAKTVQATVPDTMKKFATEQTGPAVAKGIGDIVKEAGNTAGETVPTQTDRYGILAHADEIKGKSQNTFQKLDELSNGELTKAQLKTQDAAGDYSQEGRKAYREGLQEQNDVFEYYRNHPDVDPHTLDQAKQDWKQQVALRQVNKTLAGATEASETGDQDYQIKQGKQLGDAVDRLVKNDKDVLGRAGFTDDHIDQLQQFGRIVRQEATVPKFGKMMNVIAKSLGASAGYHFGGFPGAVAGAAGEDVVAKMGSQLADRMFGKILTTPKALGTLNTALQSGVSPAVAFEQIKNDIDKSDPTWADKVGSQISQLWHDEKGELRIPSTETQQGATFQPPADLGAPLVAGKKPAQYGFDTSVKTGPDVGQTVRAEGPAIPRGERRVVPRSDEQQLIQKLFGQARQELGEDADTDDIMKRVDELKKEVKP